MAPRPLALLAPGEEAVVVEVRGGHGLVSKLAAMGIAPGRKVSMISSSLAGPAVIAVGDTRLAIGRGQLHAILVDEGASRE